MSTPASTCLRTIAVTAAGSFSASSASPLAPWLINCTISGGRGRVPAWETRIRSVLRLIAALLYSDREELRLMGIQKLGHVGIYANDLSQLRDFYSRVIGLTISDETSNAVFMTSDPDREHHEFVLFRASGPDQRTCVQQISFSCEKLEDVVDYYHRFKDNDVRFRSVTSHGNAVGL